MRASSLAAAWILSLASAACVAAVASCGDRREGGASSRDASTEWVAVTGPDAAPDAVDCDVVSCPFAPEPDAALVPCPTSPPDAGAPCPATGESCEYGSSWLLGCNALFRCTPSGWQAGARGTSAMCTEDAAACPSTWEDALEAGSFTACPAYACQYEAGTCGCVVCGIGQIRHPFIQGMWSCTPATPECPSPRPDLGSACSGDGGTMCHYGGDMCCTGAPQLRCVDGVWTGFSGQVCP
ncbi:MAG TPA: hypothetical protein VIF09_03400 [Polyangiaceae bacterium]